ncbi:HAMP domain-containing sensor histidine kinase [Actinocrispum sp. NPDC049592]|uniref:sensor histidine kinase n=1 Tax=Actinocrispum sp. NPDC049592 TaxID=3154835 RepID=UPI003445AC9A
MTLRTKFAVAFAIVAGLAIAAAMVLSYQAMAALLKVDTEQTFRALVDTVAFESKRTALTPDSFASPQGVLANVVTSRQVVTQVLDGTGAVQVRDEQSPAIPVDESDRAIAASPSPGAQAEREFIAGERFQLVTVAFGGGRGAVQIAQRASETDRLLRDLRQAVLLVGVGVALLAAAAGWMVANRVTRRLARLTTTAEQVAVTGRLDTPVPGAGRDEVGRLGAALESMLGQFLRSQEDQRRLVQDAGHELKTPLTSIRTNTTVLRRLDELSPAARTRLIDDLDSETRELVTLVNELVELADGQYTEEPVDRVDLAVLARRVADRAHRRTGREVVVRAGGDTVVEGRPVALARALGNLVENADKFAPGASPIEVEVRGGQVSVLDRGPGIPPAEATRVFDRFYRAASARGLPGSGLGLAVVRSIAEAHNGSVFAGPRPGGGAAIGFTLAQRSTNPGSL